MKKLLALLLALAMVFALVSCGSSSSSSSSSSSDSTAAADDAEDAADDADDTAEDVENAGGTLSGTLKIGMIGPLTGVAALYGSSANNGASIAVDEINAEGVITIEYNAQDDEHDAEKSVNAYNSLKDWGAQVICGTVTTTPCVAVSAEAYGDRMFMLTPSASATDVTEGKDNMFQLCFSDPNQGSASAQYIYEQGLATKVAIIYKNDDAYSTGIYETFIAKADELGLEVVSVTTFTDDSSNDFSVQLADAQNNGADLIFLPMYYTPASLIMQQAAAMEYDVLYFGVDGMDGILDLEGFDTSLAEGVMLLTPFSADATDDLTVNFVTAYESAYGSTPSQFAADGYDVIYALYSALVFYADKYGDLDVTDMSYSELCEIFIAAFTDADFSFSGVTGADMTWNADGEVSKAPMAVVIEDGVYVGM